MKTYPAVGLHLLGLAQMAGDVFHLPALKGIAAATAASPAPKVFSAVRGLETYSTRFYLEGDDRAQVHHVIPLTPEVYARLHGPYNRRNVSGAVLAYGPVLVSDVRTRAMFDSVARYALCGDAPILRELGVDPGAVSGHLHVRLDPRPGSELGDLPLTIEPACP
jgi:hypothetical protein